MIVVVTGLQGAGKSTIADGCADALAFPVFAWDWCMAALAPFEPLQHAIRTLDRTTYRALGWAMVLQGARAQLRRGRGAVLDGIARDEEIRAVRDLAREFQTPSLVALTVCDDLAVQRERVEGRRREIPGWHELTWAEVARTRREWTPPADVDLVLDSTQPISGNIEAVTRAATRLRAG
jgi:predicted kinase